jgi:hypothetical protein
VIYRTTKQKKIYLLTNQVWIKLFAVVFLQLLKPLDMRFCQADDLV